MEGFVGLYLASLRVKWRLMLSFFLPFL
jgi:hypothetical protein